MFNNLDFVQNTLEKYGLSDRFDAAETLLYLDSWRRLGPNQRGKPCGRGWVGLRGACKRGKKSDDNTEKIKESKIELADKIRAKKGMRDRNAPKPVNELPKIQKKDDPIVDKNKPLNEEEMKSIYLRLASGDISANELKAHWERAKLASTEEVLTAELKKQTIAQLQRKFPSFHARKKGELVELGLERYKEMFLPKDAPTSYSFGTSEQMAASRRANLENGVAMWTDEKIQSEANERKAKKAERQKALTNPETLDELHMSVMMNGLDNLTTEQRRKYEDLQAEKKLGQRAKREEVKATAEAVSVKKEGDIFGESKTTKHSKTGQDLHVVTMGSGDRLSKEDFAKLKDRAKTFGGYYSSFRGSGAIPGFQFKNPDDAAKFRTLDKEQRAPEQAVAVQAKKQGKLNDLADRIEEQANKTLSVERQVNTARRARMAGGVEAAANEQLKKVETIRNLAEADARGELKFLSKVSSGADIDQLNSILNQGHYEHAREVGSKTPGARMDRLYDAPRTLESIDKAKMPTSDLRPRNIRNLAEAGAKIPGLKRLSEKYRKAADNSDAISEKKQSYVGVKLRPGAETAEFKDYVKKIEAVAAKNPRMKNATSYDIAEIRSIMQDTDRLQRLGITDDATLRAALREYLPHTGKKKEESPAQSAYRRERELIGGDKSIGVDFFPTPKALAEKVASRAGIKEGMTVLDPSAGGGRLSDAAKEAGGKVKAIEMSSSLSSLLKDKGYDVESEDFLKVEPTGTYDRVVMNPPFSGGADMEHVQHAYKFLKPGGKLVAIMSEGPFFRGDKKATQFRSWLDDNSGESEKLPENSFKESNTGVNTRLVTIIKPESSMNSRSDSEDRQWARWDSAIDRIAIKYGLHLDDWKRLGPNQMGKPCGRGWVGLRGACKRGKKSEDNTAKIKASKAALADRIRARKNMSTIRSRNGKTAQGDWDIGAAFAPAKELQSSIRAKRTSPAKTKVSMDPDRASRMMNKESERARINWGRSTGDWKQKPDSTAAMDFPKPNLPSAQTTATPIAEAKARPLKMYEQAFRSLASVEGDLENAQANYDRLSQKTTKGAAQAKSRVEAEISKLKRRQENLKEALVQTNIGGKSVRVISAGRDPDGSTTALFKMAGEKRGETISASVRFKDGEAEHLPPATINGKIFSKDKAVFDHVKANAKESKEFADFVDRAVPSIRKPVDVSLLNEINSVPTIVNGISSERASKQPTPIESGKSLKSLFAEADRIGSKYQDEPTSLEERRSAKQGADRILQETGVTEAVARSTGVASMAKARDRRVSKEDKTRATESPSEASRRLFENAPVMIASSRRKSGEPRKRGRSVD